MRSTLRACWRCSASRWAPASPPRRLIAAADPFERLLHLDRPVLDFEDFLGVSLGGSEHRSPIRGNGGLALRAALPERLVVHRFGHPDALLGELSLVVVLLRRD